MHLEVLDMALTKIKLGKYLELFSQKCNIPNLTNDQVSGVNKEKEFFEPSSQVGGDTSKYKIVPPNYFACNLMHVGRDVVLPIAYNHSGKNKIVSPAYFVFKFKENDELISDYFFIFLKSSERDRYFWFHTDGSVRDGMSWEDFVDVEIELPSIEIQRKYVEIYKGMVENKAAYETGLEDLKLVCDGYIEKLRKKYPLEPIFDKLTQRIEKNDSLTSKDMYGIGLNGIIPPNQERNENSIKKCLKFYKGDILYAPSSFKNGVIVYNDKIDVGLITEEYRVFYVKDSFLNSQYLLMWLKRSELGRYIDFYTIDSVRNRFQFEELSIVNIPIPPLKIQNSIVEVFTVYNKRKEYVTILKNIIKDICPVLIKGAVEEAKRS